LAIESMAMINLPSIFSEMLKRGDFS